MKEPDLYSQAQEELAAIERQQAVLAEREAQLRQFCEMGDRLLSSPAEKEPPGLASITVSGRERQYSIDDSGIEMLESLGKTAEGFKTAKARITFVAEQVIKYYGPTKTDDLVALMDMAGVAVGGKDKCQMVSALLGRDQRFSNSRQDGWRLAKADR